MLNLMNTKTTIYVIVVTMTVFLEENILIRTRPSLSVENEQTISTPLGVIGLHWSCVYSSSSFCTLLLCTPPLGHPHTPTLPYCQVGPHVTKHALASCHPTKAGLKISFLVLFVWSGTKEHIIIDWWLQTT